MRWVGVLLAGIALVLVPLAEIAAGHVHPTLNVTVAELLNVLRKSLGNEGMAGLGVRRWGPPLELAGNRSGD